jgi:hypothetical protein
MKEGIAFKETGAYRYTKVRRGGCNLHQERPLIVKGKIISPNTNKILRKPNELHTKHDVVYLVVSEHKLLINKANV